MTTPCTEKERLMGMQKDIEYIKEGQTRMDGKMDKIFDLLDGPGGTVAKLEVTKEKANTTAKRQWYFIGGATLAAISAWVKELFV